MRSRGLVVVAVLAVLTACSPSGQFDDDGRAGAIAPPLRIVTIAGEDRTYIAQAPELPTEPMPLLIMLHGAGGDGARAERVTGFTDAALANEFVVAYPNGTRANFIEGELAWNAGACCGLASADRVDDVTFVLTMIAELQAEYSIDASRIYLAGYSNGGMLSYRLACEHSELFAGVAVISGAHNYSDCEPTQPVPLLIIHGVADLTVPFEGGETNVRTATRFGQWMNTSVEYATNFWVTHDDCKVDAVITELPPTSTAVYSGCTDDVRVEVVTIAEGNHSWPRVDTLGVDGSQLVLTFFGLI